MVAFPKKMKIRTKRDNRVCKGNLRKAKGRGDIVRAVDLRDGFKL